jgi:hypothetical protein
MVQRRRFDIVKQMFILNYGDRAGKILVADFFGGDGNWLSCFKSVDNKIEKYVKTLYNEIECNKYDEYKNSFNYSFNLAAEELLPKLKEKKVKIEENMSIKEKLQLGQKYTSKVRVNKTQLEIEKALIEMKEKDIKINVSSVAKYTKKTRITINNYKFLFC